jgi:hypothetical protein
MHGNKDALVPRSRSRLFAGKPPMPAITLWPTSHIDLFSDATCGVWALGSQISTA